MKFKDLQFWSGVFLVLFVFVQFSNHLFPSADENPVDFFRTSYRTFVIKPLLVLSAAIQIYSVIRFWVRRQRSRLQNLDKL